MNAGASPATPGAAPDLRDEAGAPPAPWLTPRRARWALALIITLAAALRLWNLAGCPAGLFRDEAEKGYNAWALATRGGVLDFSGGATPGPPVAWHPWPWMITVMGNRTSAAYHYASVPWMALGGLSVATTRLAAALAGTAAVALAGLVLARAWGAAPGLLAALWMALSLWALVFSRWALEGSLVPPLEAAVLAGVWFAEHATVRRRWGWPLAGAALGLMAWVYTGAQPFVAAWSLCLLAIYRRRFWPPRHALAPARAPEHRDRLKAELPNMLAPARAPEHRDRLKAELPNMLVPARSPELWLALALFLLPVVPTLMVTLGPGGARRLERVALWSDPAMNGAALALGFARNWLAHFDPRFLFLAGDANARHGVPGLGVLGWLDAWLLPCGLVWLMRGRRPLRGALLAALLCGPIPAALTRVGVPHALRALPMMLPAVALSGAGLWATLQWIERALARRMKSSGNHAAAATRGRRWAAALGVAAVAFAAQGVGRYYRFAGGDPLAQVAFENGQRQSWSALREARLPDQRVFINGYIPYAPYYQLFFTQAEPRRAARPGGLEGDAFIYFNPEQTPEAAVWQRQMRPGDWLLAPMRPEALAAPDGSPWLTPEQSRRAGEPWITLNQKPLD